MELFKKTSYISAGNFPSSKNKKDQPSKKFSYFLKKIFSYIQQMEFSSSKFKKLL